MEKLSDDERIVAALERTDKMLEIRKQLDSSLRKGFVELASGRFSKGYSDSRNLSPNTFPEFIDAHTKIGSDGDHLIAFNPAKVDALVDEFDGISFSTSHVEGKSSELRRRQTGKSVGAMDTETEGRGTENKQDDAIVNRNNSKQYLQQWLGYVPEGRIESSRKAFLDSIKTAVELAVLMQEGDRGEMMTHG